MIIRVIERVIFGYSNSRTLFANKKYEPREYKMKKAIGVWFISMLFVSEVFAGGTYTGKITKVWAEPIAGNYVMVSMDGSPSGSPSCASSSVYHFAFSIVDEIGEALLSMALSSYVSQKEVRIIGNGQCTLHSNVETLENIRMQ